VSPPERLGIVKTKRWGWEGMEGWTWKRVATNCGTAAFTSLTRSKMLAVNGVQTVEHGIKAVLTLHELLPSAAHGLRLLFLLQNVTYGSGKR